MSLSLNVYGTRMRKERKKKVETKFYELHTEIIIKNTITTDINLK